MTRGWVGWVQQHILKRRVKVGEESVGGTVQAGLRVALVGRTDGVLPTWSKYPVGPSRVAVWTGL